MTIWFAPRGQPTFQVGGTRPAAGERKALSASGSPHRSQRWRRPTLPPDWGTGIAFVTEIIKPIHKARTCTTMQHLRLSTSRPIRPLPHSRQRTNVLPLSGPSLFGGILPEGVCFFGHPHCRLDPRRVRCGGEPGAVWERHWWPFTEDRGSSPGTGGSEPRRTLDALFTSPSARSRRAS